MFPQYAYSLVFFAATSDIDSLIMKISNHDLSEFMGAPELWQIAITSNATLIHCINGWDGYSINYISKSGAGWTI